MKFNIKVIECFAKVVFVLFICSPIFTPLFGQWESDVRLTNNDSLSYTSENNAWCVATTGDTVHVVWYDARDGLRQIYYKRSTNGGTNWGSDVHLVNSSAWGIFPSVAVFNSNIHVVWNEQRDGNEEIYYKRSTDNGTSWGADTRLTNTPLSSEYPSVAASGTNVHVTWMDSVGANNYEVYYKRSTDSGTSWEADVQLTNEPSLSIYPSVAVSGSKVHVVWSDERDGNYEIYYKRNPTGNTGIEENTIRSIECYCGATIICGPLQLPEGKNCKIFDITGQVVMPARMKPGIYFVEIDNKIVQKVVKIR